MTIWQKITELNLWDESNEDTAGTLSALTSGPIAVGSLRLWLRVNGLLSRNPVTNAWAGSLAALLDQASPFYAGMLEFVEHVFDDQMQTIATHQPQWAEKAAVLLGSLVAEEIITLEHVAAFYQLDGGLVFPSGVTAQQVADAKAERAALAIRTALEAVFTTKIWNPVIEAIQESSAVTEADVKLLLAELLTEWT